MVNIQGALTPSQINALKHIWAAGNSNNCVLLTEENKQVLLLHDLIVKDTVKNTYIITIKGENICSENETAVIIQYPLQSDKKSKHRGTSRSFEETFQTASPAYINALVAALFKSGGLGKLKNIDYIVSQLLLNESLPSTLSKSMINKSFMFFRDLMNKKFDKLPLESKVKILVNEKDAIDKKYNKVANTYLYNLKDGVYNDLVHRKGNQITKLINKNGKYFTFQSYTIVNNFPSDVLESKTFKVESIPQAYKQSIVETCIMQN